MGSVESKVANSGSRRRSRGGAVLLSEKQSAGDHGKRGGRSHLGPAERGERRFLRAQDSVDEVGRGSIGGGDRASIITIGARGAKDMDTTGGGISTGVEQSGHNDFADIDKTVDRYDYLIAFPHSKERKPRPEWGTSGGRDFGEEQCSTQRWRYGEVAHEEEEDEDDSERKGHGDSERITLTEAHDIWYSAVPGDEVTKMAAKESLRREWEARFRASTDDSEEVSISRSEWVRLAREVIVNTLFEKSGLQLKLSLSKEGDKVLCRIRAPIALLERQAAKERYRLQFRGEVDPGEGFWTEEEIAEEQRMYSKDEANETLEKLFQVERISPNDLAVFDEEVVPNQWSRRVHTLERIADRVPVTNRFPAYAEYTNEDKHRHLFQTYSSIRGRTLFRAKDRLLMTKSILSGLFDMGILQAKGVVDAVCALHDANRGEIMTTEVLLKRWTLGLCRERSDRVGAPMVSMQVMDDGRSAPWFLQPFCQPLHNIRDYYGEKLAFYFAWLGFYGWALVIPAIYGLVAEMYLVFRGVTFNEDGWNYAQVSVVLMITAWDTIYQELWKREEKIVAVKWGTSGFEEAEKDRPNFEGDKESAGGGRRRSPVTNTYHTYFPDHKRKVRQMLGLFVVMLFVAGLLALVLLVEWLENYLEDDLGYTWGGIATSLLASVQIQVLSFVYSKVVMRLNDFENYQTETAYEDNLIFKTFLFQMFNNYSALAYTAFVENGMGSCSESCMIEVRTLLILIFVVRFAMVAVEMIIPYLQLRLANRRAENKLRGQALRDRDGAADAIRDGRGGRIWRDWTGVGTLDLDEEPMEAELRLPEYEGPFSDYSAIVLQYGLITMFVAALPAVVFFAVMEVLLQMRTDSYKLVALMRRPDPEMAEGVGMWSNLMQAMGFLSVFSNTAIICFTGGTLNGRCTEDKVLVWLLFEHILLLIKVLLHVLIPHEPAWLTQTKARQRFVEHKHLHGFVRDQDDDAGRGGLRTQTDRERHKLRGNLDVVGLQFEGNQKGRRLPPMMLAELERLRTELREVTRALKIVTEQLQRACQHERFNEQTGIGETKHGLPVGCLHIKLIRLDGMEGDPQASGFVCDVKKKWKMGFVAQQWLGQRRLTKREHWP